ncbi:MAG: purine-nucleoside phosphorylase [Oscillospiraceae bacterium]|nr:purine-nucleoside phosphorylase [Oscillospiraceae bacterium]
MNTYEKLQSCLAAVRAKTNFVPSAALVLGSGLGDFADTQVKTAASIAYDEIAGFPVSTVSGHRGQFVFGYIGDVPVVVMQGRVHYYEGYPMPDVVLPIRLMGLLGAKTILLTNAAGGINYTFNVGDFMLISDHIGSFIPSPLIGENIDALGTRFPDMSDIYSGELRARIRNAAANLGTPLREGVYAQLTGPQFETPGEIRMLRALGADAVGMSTACEAIAARHMGMRVCGISCISNLACGLSPVPLTHDEVKETADRVAPLFKKLVSASISLM